MYPAFLAASSTPTLPIKTIKSAIEMVPLKLFWIFCRVPITFDNSSGLFTSQLLCGSKQILAPLAPPLLSDPLKVDAEAQAVFTISEMLNPLSEIIFFKVDISPSLNV